MPVVLDVQWEGLGTRITMRARRRGEEGGRSDTDDIIVRGVLDLKATSYHHHGMTSAVSCGAAGGADRKEPVCCVMLAAAGHLTHESA